MTHPLTNSKIAALPKRCAAFLLSFCPMLILKADAPPIPNKRAVAVQSVERGKAIFVAAFPNSPIFCPMKNWSTIL